jgi:hypothetical protein
MPSNDYVNTARNNRGRDCFLCGPPQAYINPSFVTAELVFVQSLYRESVIRVCGRRPTRVVLGEIFVCKIVSCVNVTQRTK